MTSRRSDVLDALPSGLPTTSIPVSVLAATGCGTSSLAAIYGDTTPALWGGAAFGVSGVLWQLADRGP